MTPREKAWDLVQKQYSDAIYKSLAYGVATTETAKKCAFICVDEIILTLNNIYGYHPEECKEHPYWKEVKEEIQKL